MLDVFVEGEEMGDGREMKVSPGNPKVRAPDHWNLNIQEVMGHWLLPLDLRNSSSVPRPRQAGSRVTYWGLRDDRENREARWQKKGRQLVLENWQLEHGTQQTLFVLAPWPSSS